MHLEEVGDPLLWWSKHEGKFPIVAYLVRAILYIPIIHIEIERIFFIVGIFTSLCCCWIGLKNLDFLVLKIKNWFDDPTIGFEDIKEPQDVDEFGKVDKEILDLLDVEFSMRLKIM